MRAISASELYAAHNKAVEPSLEVAFTSDREARSFRTPARSPALTALATGLSPAARTMLTSKMEIDTNATSNRRTRVIATTFHRLLTPRGTAGTPERRHSSVTCGNHS